MAFQSKMNELIRKSIPTFLIVIRFSTAGVICRVKIRKLLGIFGHFRVGWDFPNGALLGDFDPPISTFQLFVYPKGASLNQTNSLKPSFVKTSCELWYVDELMKQESEEKRKKVNNKILKVWKVYISITWQAALVESISTKFNKYLTLTLPFVPNLVWTGPVVLALERCKVETTTSLYHMQPCQACKWFYLDKIQCEWQCLLYLSQTNTILGRREVPTGWRWSCSESWWVFHCHFKKICSRLNTANHGDKLFRYWAVCLSRLLCVYP